jgi:type IV pilus assembly protein PilB
MVIRDRKKLGDVLVEASKITKEQLEDILKEQKTTNKRLGELLVEHQYVTEQDILEVLETQLGIPKLNIESIVVDNEAVKAIPESLANRYTLIPVGFNGKRIKVVMTDPLNIFAVDDVRISSGYEVEPYLASKDDIKKAIGKYYSTQMVKKAADDLSRESVVKNDDEENTSEFDAIKNAPVVRLVESIISNAVKQRASDIHIEPFDKYVKIRYRIDGELQEVLRPKKDTLGALVTRIKILSNLNIAEKRLPQDGRILIMVDEKDIDLRVSILPTVFGEKVVIRVFTRDNSVVSKENLGLVGDDLVKLDNIIKSPYGIILVTGPTGSGKSTTLYTVLNDLNDNDKNIVTVEDPVENLVEGVNQVNVNVKAGLTFAAGLRSILRQDPDIVMIGEIRDNETAEIAVRAAITGHLVLSTIHTNDAPSAVVRLTDMGIEPYLVATSIAGVLAQRLVRRICPHCIEQHYADNFEKDILGFNEEENIPLYKGKGCTYCNNTGYLGRIAVFDIMEITRKHREYIIKNQSTDVLRDLSLESGMKTIKMACQELVLKGITTVDEMIKIAFLKE